MIKNVKMQVLDGGGNSPGEIMVHAVMAEMNKNGIKITLPGVLIGIDTYLENKKREKYQESRAEIRSADDAPDGSGVVN